MFTIIYILAFYIFFQLYNRQAYSACLLYVRNSSFHYSVSCLSAFFLHLIFFPVCAGCDYSSGK